MESEVTLQFKVIEELTWDPSLDASRIQVAMSHSVVTLTGNVRSHAQKLAAERAAKRVLGMHLLANDLHVRPPFPHQRKETEIDPPVARLRQGLAWSAPGVAVVQDDLEVSY